MSSDIFSDNVNYHNVIFGSTGKGRSFIIEQYAKEHNISYEEAEKHFQPSKEELEQRKAAQEQAKRKEEDRLLKVKEAYWEAYSDKESEFYDFHDAITFNMTIEKATQEQVKELFLMIPSEIFGLGIHYGFSDTEVRDNLHEFVRDNLTEIFKRFVDKGLLGGSEA